MVEKLKELYPEKIMCWEPGKTSAKEKNACFTIECDKNIKETIVKVWIDGCLIPDQDKKKCDYMFIIPEGKVLIMVECKGNDVKKAIEQIRSTIQILKPLVDLSSQKYAFIVPTMVAPAIQSNIQIVMKKFMREYGIELIVKSHHCDFNLANKKVN
ncbi:MAG TPA: hypothetical protein PK592_05195 [Candidatus Cloacimonas sp.]|jgi:hypothetical protein|nr:hypothetical protein [Candidatus Cloacimonas sp.]HRR50786.1 hypothetical protein [Candidatus Cloacimonas sp.]